MACTFDSSVLVPGFQPKGLGASKHTRCTFTKCIPFSSHSFHWPKTLFTRLFSPQHLIQSTGPPSGRPTTCWGDSRPRQCAKDFLGTTLCRGESDPIHEQNDVEKTGTLRIGVSLKLRIQPWKGTASAPVAGRYSYPLDVFAMGCTLFELFTGKILFPGKRGFPGVPGGSHKSLVKDLELLIDMHRIRKPRMGPNGSDTQATSGGVAGMEAPLWSFGHTTGCSIRR